MRRRRFGPFLAAFALVTAAVVPLLAQPAGAATNCDAGEFPSTFAAQSGIKVTCTSDAGVNVNHIEIHDADNVAWHHGTAHGVSLAPASPNKATTAGSLTIKFAAGKIQTRDIRRPISGFASTKASVFRGGTFITAVAPLNCTTTCTSATLSQTALLTETAVTARVENTTNRYVTDATCNPRTTVAAGSNGALLSSFAGAGTLNVASTAAFLASGSLQVGTTTPTGFGHLTYTGKTATAFTGVTTVTGSGHVVTGAAVFETSDPLASITSATAKFVAGDVGKSISGGAFPAGTFISAITSPTVAALSNPASADCTINNGGNPTSPHPIAPIVGVDQIQIGAVTYSGGIPQVFNSDPMMIELSNSTGGGQAFSCSGSTLALTAAAKADFGGLNSLYIGLPVRVDKLVGATHTVVASTITAVSVAGNTSATISPACPTGVTASNAVVAIGALDGGAPANNAPMMTLGAELNLNPTLVSTQDNCDNHTFEGFMVVGGWENPGPTYIGNASAPKVSVGQVAFPTSVISFNGFVVPKRSGDTVDANPHYNFSFPILPTSLAVCLSDTAANGGTPVDPTALAFGVNPTTLSVAPFLPTASGNIGDPTVRSLLPETGTFSQHVQLITNPSTVIGTFTASCTIGADTNTPGFGCGDG